MASIDNQVVAQVEEFKGVAKGSGRPYTKFTLHLVDGSKYNCGFKRPPANAGDVVSFESNPTAYGEECVQHTLKVIKGTGEVPTAVSSSHATPTSIGARSMGKTFPVAADHPDRSIIRQNSLARALEVANLTMDNGYDEVSMAGGAEPTRAKVMHEVMEMVIPLALQFEAFSTGELYPGGLTEYLAKQATTGE
jgi:hypothetical protein